MEKNSYIPPKITSVSFQVELGFGLSGINSPLSRSFNFMPQNNDEGYFRNEHFDYGYSNGNGNFFGD